MGERNKPGVGMLKKLMVQEEKHKTILVELARRKQVAREKATGKGRARGYVQKWLEALTTAELREEAALRGYRWEVFESLEHAVGVIVANMFEELTPEEQAFLLEASDGEEGISGIIEGMDAPDDDEEGVG